MSNQGIFRSGGGPLRKIRRVYTVAGNYEWVAPADHDPRWPVEVRLIGSAWWSVPKTGTGAWDRIYGIVAGQRIQVHVASADANDTTTFGTYLTALYTAYPSGGPELIGSVAKTSPCCVAWGTRSGASTTAASEPGGCIVEAFSRAPYPGGRYGVEPYPSNRSGL